MDAILLQLISQYAEGGLITIVLILLLFLHKRISTLSTETKEEIQKIEKSIQDRFTKDETKTLVQQEMKLVEQALSNINNTIDRMGRSIDRTDDTLSEVRTCLLNLTRRRD